MDESITKHNLELLVNSELEGSLPDIIQKQNMIHRSSKSGVLSCLVPFYADMKTGKMYGFGWLPDTITFPSDVQYDVGELEISKNVSSIRNYGGFVDDARAILDQTMERYNNRKKK